MTGMVAWDWHYGSTEWAWEGLLDCRTGDLPNPDWPATFDGQPQSGQSGDWDLMLSTCQAVCARLDEAALLPLPSEGILPVLKKVSYRGGTQDYVDDGSTVITIGRSENGMGNLAEVQKGRFQVEYFVNFVVIIS